MLPGILYVEKHISSFTLSPGAAYGLYTCESVDYYGWSLNCLFIWYKFVNTSVFDGGPGDNNSWTDHLCREC